MKNKKRLIGAIIVMALVAFVFVAGYTFARYYKALDAGGGTATIARWSFGSKNVSQTINLSEEKIKPGSHGEFEIEVDATGSEVPVEYEILCDSETNIPANMKFTAVTKDETGKIVATVGEKNSFTNLAEELEGTIQVENNNQKRTITVIWDWPFNSEDTTNTDANHASQANLACSFDIQIIGRQAAENSSAQNLNP